jgi:hypothetical protein
LCVSLGLKKPGDFTVSEGHGHPLVELVTKVKPYTNSFEVHPRLSNSRHPVDGALVGGGSLWPWRESLAIVKPAYYCC